jgi:hypothetical protein
MVSAPGNFYTNSGLALHAAVDRPGCDSGLHRPDLHRRGPEVLRRRSDADTSMRMGAVAMNMKPHIVMVMASARRNPGGDEEPSRSLPCTGGQCSIRPDIADQCGFRRAAPTSTALTSAGTGYRVSPRPKPDLTLLSKYKRGTIHRQSACSGERILLDFAFADRLN